MKFLNPYVAYSHDTLHTLHMDKIISAVASVYGFDIHVNCLLLLFYDTFNITDFLIFLSLFMSSGHNTLYLAHKYTWTGSFHHRHLCKDLSILLLH